MSSQPSKSIFLSGDGELVVHTVSEDYSIQGSECLVRVYYSAINPCDLNFYHMGLKSFITGFEMSGVVEKTGPDSPFKVGDAVCGISPVLVPMPSSHGTHQDLVVARSELLYKIPSSISPKDASAICMAAQTAADALFNVIGLGLPVAGVDGINSTGQGILIWGGASSVGNMAIQMARIAGFQYIFTTASAKNHEGLRQLGATHCFDYGNSSVVQEIQESQKALGIELAMGFDTVGKGVMGPDTGHSSTPGLTKSALGPNISANDTRLVCTLPVPGDSAFGFCTSYRPAGDRNAMGAPQDPEAPSRVRKVVEHCLNATENTLRLPVVTMVQGDIEAGIEAIKRVAAGKMSMEKLVLKHPLQ